MSLDIWAAATALFVASFTPGPNNAICASIGATYGYTRALPFALGVTVGYPALIAVVGLGLAGLLAAFPQLHLAIKICGASFLLYLAWKIATAKNTPATNAKVPGFWRAFLFQWFNPKGVPVSFSIIAAYADAGDTLLADIAALMVISGVMAFGATSTWALVGSGISRLLNSPRALATFNGVMGALLALSLIPVFL